MTIVTIAIHVTVELPDSGLGARTTMRRFTQQIDQINGGAVKKVDATYNASVWVELGLDEWLNDVLTSNCVTNLDALANCQPRDLQAWGLEIANIQRLNELLVAHGRRFKPNGVG